MRNCKRAVDLDLRLRTPQVRYLEYLAARDAGPLSGALEWIVFDRRQSQPVEAVAPARKVNKHLTLSMDSYRYIEKLSVAWGLPISDTVRRLIDEAQMKDETI
jgi:hypothetical protein